MVRRLKPKLIGHPQITALKVRRADAAWVCSVLLPRSIQVPLFSVETYLRENAYKNIVSNFEVSLPLFPSTWK
jgi:hypothetical protein